MSEDTEVTTTPVVTGDTSTEVKETSSTAEGQPEGEDKKADAASDPAPAQPKKVDTRQKKIAELSYQLREQQRQNDRLLGLVEKTVSKGSEGQAPKIEDYQTIDDFLNARDEYRDKQRTGNKPEQKGPNPQYAEYVQSGVNNLISAGSDKYDDFVELADTTEAFATPMRDAILELDELENQVEVSRYLFLNQKEMRRISKLSPIRQAVEIGKLEDKVTSKPATTKRPSAAPDPIKPVGGAATSTDEIKPTMNFKDFMKVRNRQLGRK